MHGHAGDDAGLRADLRVDQRDGRRHVRVVNSASTASASGGHASAAHSPNARSASPRRPGRPPGPPRGSCRTGRSDRRSWGSSPIRSSAAACRRGSRSPVPSRSVPGGRSPAARRSDPETPAGWPPASAPARAWERAARGRTGPGRSPVRARPRQGSRPARCRPCRAAPARAPAGAARMACRCVPLPDRRRARCRGWSRSGAGRARSARSHRSEPGRRRAPADAAGWHPADRPAHPARPRRGPRPTVRSAR